jgi:small subunit ribosomal protein S9
MSTTIKATGRRKTSTAKIFLSPSKEGAITINKRALEEYFPGVADQQCVTMPLSLTENEGKYKIAIQVRGGGTTGQKEAIRHGISRALVLLDEEHRPTLKKNKLLKRDPRCVERKKYGLYKARKDSPFVKR